MEGILLPGAGLQAEVLPHRQAVVPSAGHLRQQLLGTLGDSGSEPTLQLRTSLIQCFQRNGQCGVGFFQLGNPLVLLLQLGCNFPLIPQGCHPSLVLAQTVLQPLLLHSTFRQQLGSFRLRLCQVVGL